jgi:hypothetical protein
MIATAPLAVRNRFAETVLAARHDAAARASIVDLVRRCAEGDVGDEWLAASARAHEEALCARARAAVAALADRPLGARDGSLAEALADARRLFGAHLYFEVHEVLEPHWVRARGEARQALQGLIQIAVGYQHLANGNVTGARALLEEGAARLHGGAVAEAPLEAFARAVARAAAALPQVDWARVPPFPSTP